MRLDRFFFIEESDLTRERLPDLFPVCRFQRTDVLYNFFGDDEAVARPDPIPNSAVKHCVADGSGPIGSARVGRRQLFQSGLGSIHLNRGHFLDKRGSLSSPR